jgi:hypothetical protein
MCYFSASKTHSHHKPTGLLHPLEPPKAPWQELTMDLIEAVSIAKLFVDNIVKLHMVCCSRLSHIGIIFLQANSGKT